MDEQKFSLNNNKKMIHYFYLSFLDIIQLKFQLVNRLLIKINIPKTFNMKLKFDNCP